jgi:polyhydroxyalkanoate synthase subunit PhaC
MSNSPGSADPSRLRTGAGGGARLAALSAAAGVDLAGELARVALGRSSVGPDPRDRRFRDPAWTAHPAYRRLGQSYLAACAALDQVVDGLELAGERRTAERTRLLGSLVTGALAPTNTVLGNPAALKRAFDTGGASLLQGSLRAWDDVRHHGGLPRMVPRESLRVGRELGVTPGDVVQRDVLAELLRYAPVTPEVRERPVLVVPPMIGHYYFLDLRPGRSFVEHAVAQGLQTYLLSWRNPTPEHRDWSLATYVERIESAIDAIREATGSPDVNLVGFCAGGLLTSLVLGRQATSGERRVHAASFAVTMLDFGEAMPLTALTSDLTLRLSGWWARRRGIRSAEATGRALTWMRSQDLVWNYWVNNYLMGLDPPEFDILSWNADGTNLPAALFGQFVDLLRHNRLGHPGSLEVGGTAIDLSRVEVPMFVAGAVGDHLTPWKQTYRTTQLLGGESVFALSNAGHIASLVNPPGNPKASYATADVVRGETAEQWRERAVPRQGSWWEAWATWMLERSGDTRLAAVPGSDDALGPAPGRYVREKARSRARRPADVGNGPQVLVSPAGVAYSVVGSGPPLLWITGYHAPSAMFATFVSRFSEHFTCISYDLRGCGHSDLPPSSLSIRSMAADALDVLESAGVGPAHVLGFSLGGMIAQEVALAAPERVRTLVLASTTAGGLESDYAPPPIELGIELTRIGHRLGTLRPDLRVAFTQAWAAGTHDTAARLPYVQAPTLVLHGEEDRLLRVGNADRLARLIPGAELVRLPGATHLFFLDSDEGLDVALRWLQEHRDDAPPADPVPHDRRAAPTGAAAALRTQALPFRHSWKAMRNRAARAAGLLQQLPGMESNHRR